MSGCVHCVWDLYQEEVREWEAKRKDYYAKIAAANPGERGATEAPPPPPPLIEPVEMDPTLKAFLELEKRLKGS